MSSTVDMRLQAFGRQALGREGLLNVALPATADNLSAIWVAELAVTALIGEADLTPKPGLVDRRGSGAHADLDLALLHRSAQALEPCFRAMAAAAIGATPSRRLRERLAEIGRDGEGAMFAATSGVNTHKGAIWALGLLVAGAIMSEDPADGRRIAALAGSTARHPDTKASPGVTNGSRVGQRFKVDGARGEAQAGFPHVVDVGLPALRGARARGQDETSARLDALVAIMAELDDTCLLHRGGLAALDAAKQGARRVLALGGTSHRTGREALRRLDVTLLDMNASPGGSGDLLAATLLLDSLAVRRLAPRAACDQLGESTSWKS